MHRPVLLLFVGLCLVARPEAAPVPKPDPSTYNLCAGCHGPEGRGMDVGDLKLAASLVDSEILRGDPEFLALVVLKGIAKEDDKYLEHMVPQELALDDATLAAVLTYVRDAFGDKAPPVPVATVTATRAKYKDIPDSITRAKLKELIDAKARESRPKDTTP